MNAKPLMFAASEARNSKTTQPIDLKFFLDTHLIHPYLYAKIQLKQINLIFLYFWRLEKSKFDTEAGQPLLEVKSGCKVENLAFWMVSHQK